MMVLGRVAAVLFCLELTYLAVANALLRSQAIQRAVASSEGFALEFGRAYSLWPGHVEVRDLSLRVEDYNVQFEVALASATLDIAISELPFKKFRITRLVAEGTRFRMRHKLIAVGDDAERVAAYPKIKGFADPPYFVGVHAPPLTDAEADSELWKVRVENVEATVSELWVMEYRYEGPGHARGSFVVHPTRWVQVQPAALWLEGGKLSLGGHLVAQRVVGKLTCDIPDMRVQEREGAAVLKDISATARLELRGGGLDFLQAYLARFGAATYGGRSEINVDAAMVRGVLAPRTRVDVRATPFEVHHDVADLAGDVMLSLQRPQDPSLELAVGAPRLTLAREGATLAKLEGLAASLTLRGADLTQSLPLGAARLALARAHTDSWSWLAPPGTKLDGALDAAFELARSEAGELAGGARLALSRGQISHADFGLSGDVKGDMVWARDADPDAAVEVRKLDVRLSSATLRSGTKRSKGFDASIEGTDLRLTPTSTGSAAGRLRARVSSAEALLPLVMSAPLKGITSSALNLQQLDAETSVRLTRRGLSLRVLEARSGNLRARGYFEQAKDEPRGAFLLSSGPLNVGVTLSGGETEVSPFVGDGWLSTAWPRVSGADPGPS